VLLVAAEESGVEAALLAGVMMAESSGRIGVTSRAGALGLFQLSPVTAAERARVLDLPEPTEEQLLSDPLLNARLGAHYFADLLRRFDQNVEAALVAYNRGPTRVRRWIAEAGGYEAWRQTRMDAGGSPLLEYAQRVLRYRDLFRERGTLQPDPVAKPVEKT
jgi:soluble lytic murein transglycosylase